MGRTQGERAGYRLILCSRYGYSSRITINDVVVACQGGCPAFLDTGTALLAGPGGDILNIQQAIGAVQGQYGLVRSGPLLTSREPLPRPPESRAPFCPRNDEEDCWLRLVFKSGQPSLPALVCACNGSASGWSAERLCLCDLCGTLLFQSPHSCWQPPLPFSLRPCALCLDLEGRYAGKPLFVPCWALSLCC